MSYVRTSTFLLFLVSFALTASAQITWTRHGFSTADAAVWVTTGDFNRDGRPDVATTASSSNALLVFSNQGSNRFALMDEHALESANMLDTADLNGDGNLDLLVSSFSQSLVSIFRGVGDGTFLRGGTVTLSYPSRAVIAADFDGNHTPDLLSEECDQSAQDWTCVVKVYFNNGSGAFQTSKVLAGPSTSVRGFALPPVAVGDFNLDGRADVAAAVVGGVDVFINTGGSNFAAPARVSAPSVGSVAVGSFNRDRYPDLLVSTAAPCSGPPCPSYAAVYQNDGTAHFGLRSRTIIHGDYLLAADVTGDGIQDVVGLNNGHFDGRLQYIAGVGDGRFKSAVSIAFPDTADMVIARDMNLDGREDLLFPEFIGADVAVMTNNNAQVICGVPGSASAKAKICSPLAGSTVPTTFTVTGSGNSPAGLKRIEVWIDGAKRAESPDDQIRRTVTVGAGRHRVTVVAVDRHGASFSVSAYVTAQ